MQRYAATVIRVIDAQGHLPSETWCCPDDRHEAGIDMKIHYRERLQSLKTLCVTWQTQVLLKVAIVGLVIILSALIFITPGVNSGLHADYLNNLNQLESMSDDVHRNHRLASQGLEDHLDTLEADLEQMEQSANLSLVVPDFVDSAYESRLKKLITAYKAGVSDIQAQIHVSKQSTELLTTAKQGFRQLLGELKTDLSFNVSREAMALISELEYSLIVSEIDESWLQNLNQFIAELPSAQSALQPVLLHASMINVQRQELADASERLHALYESLSQPSAIKSAYLEKFHATLLMNTRLSWLRYAVVAMLLALCGFFIRASNRARESAQDSVSKAQQLQLESDRWVIQTHLAVIQCNEVLESIGNGEFEHRLEFPFDESLEVLRESINQTADRVEFTMLELARVMQAVREGRFDVRLDSRVQGTLGVQVDETISSLDTAIADICQVMDNLRDGCFSTRVNVECMGRLDELKSSINASMCVLDGAISDVVGLVRYQADGDFNRSIEVAGKGQLELLATSINSSSTKVHEMVHEIRQVSATVELSSDRMKGNSRTWCEHTALHSESVSSLLKKVDLVKSAIQTNCKSVANANVLVGRSQEEAGKGMRIADEAVRLMKNINEKSLKIATISQVLDTIARQTNLLALNAAVEAVRAGERGAGFSVVASEVKDLARQSAAASTDITELISATMQDIRQGAESVENTGMALKAINDSILDVEKISQLIVEQSHGQEEDMDSIVNIVNQTRQIIMEDLEMAKGINATSENLGILAQEVNQLLCFFKTNGPDADTTDVELAMRCSRTNT